MGDTIVRGKKIMVADDTATQRVIMLEMLTADGHIVTCTCSGSEALDALEHDKFDIIFLDVRMGDVNGLDVLKMYRMSERNPSPIYFMTVDSSEKMAKALMDAGAAGVLLKPTAIADIRRAIADSFPAPAQPVLQAVPVTGAGGRRPYAEAGAPSPALRAVQKRYVDQTVLERLRTSSPNPEFVEHLIATVVVEIHRVTRNLISCIAARSAVETRDCADELVSIAASIGAVRLQSLAKTLSSMRQGDQQADTKSVIVDLYDTARLTVDELTGLRSAG
jgi:CheY-like chemotaxis protein